MDYWSKSCPSDFSNMLYLLNYHEEYPEGQHLDVLLDKYGNTQSFKNLRANFLTNGP